MHDIKRQFPPMSVLSAAGLYGRLYGISDSQAVKKIRTICLAPSTGEIPMTPKKIESFSIPPPRASSPSIVHRRNQIRSPTSSLFFIPAGRQSAKQWFFSSVEITALSASISCGKSRTSCLPKYGAGWPAITRIAGLCSSNRQSAYPLDSHKPIPISLLGDGIIPTSTHFNRTDLTKSDEQSPPLSLKNIHNHHCW